MADTEIDRRNSAAGLYHGVVLCGVPVDIGVGRASLGPVDIRQDRQTAGWAPRNGPSSRNRTSASKEQPVIDPGQLTGRPGWRTGRDKSDVVIGTMGGDAAQVLAVVDAGSMEDYPASQSV